MKETFGNRFARLRKEKGLTQEEIGKRLNISGQGISKWENDLSTPDISMLKDISEIFEISIDELCGNNQNRDVILNDPKSVDINKMVLRLTVDSAGGDKVRINLPMAIILIWLESGAAMPTINQSDVLNKIDLKQIISLVEQGAFGKLLEVESADGDTVSIVIE